MTPTTGNSFDREMKYKRRQHQPDLEQTFAEIEAQRLSSTCAAFSSVLRASSCATSDSCVYRFFSFSYRARVICRFGLRAGHRVQQIDAQFQTVELDPLRLVKRPLVVRIRFEQNRIRVSAMRNDRDDPQQHREDRRENADLLAERIGGFDFGDGFQVQP